MKAFNIRLSLQENIVLRPGLPASFQLAVAERADNRRRLYKRCPALTRTAQPLIIAVKLFCQSLEMIWDRGQYLIRNRL